MSYLNWRRERQRAVAAGAELIETACGPVEVKVAGDGPAVLVSHGALGGYDQGLWARKHLKLSGFTVVAVSRPGYLRTPISSGPTWPEQADLFAALLDRLGIASAAAVGISAGGMPAVHFAARHPDRCWALVLWSAVTQPMRREARMAFMATPLHVAFELAAWSMMGWAFTRAAKRRGWPNAEALIDLIDCTTPCMPRRAGWVTDVRASGAIDPSIHLTIRVPALVLHAHGDPIVPHAIAEATARAIPGAELEMYDGGTHVLAASHPQSGDRVAAFLAARGR